MRPERQHTERMRVIEGLDAALAHTKFVLFQPFDFMTWLSFGVIVFIATLFQGGGGGGGGFNSAGLQGTRSQTLPWDWDEPPNPDALVRSGVEWVTDHLGIITLLGASALLIGVAFAVLLAWLRSRGQMMFIRAVALNDPRIGENWRQTGPRAWSLFLFQLAFMAAQFVIGAALLAGAAAAVVYQANKGEGALMAYVWGLLPWLLIMMPLGLACWLVQVLLRCFVAPIMLHLDQPCLAAWDIFFPIARTNVGPLLLFLLFRVGYTVLFAMITMLAGCLTCCIGFLPVVNQTLTAPLHVFDRSFSLYVLGSLGPRFEIIPPRETAGPGTPGGEDFSCGEQT